VPVTVRNVAHRDAEFGERAIVLFRTAVAT
jgi:hypothetical protein